MNKERVSAIRGIIVIFWLGFFMAISFMEAPLKFTAPGITIVQGVQIGRIIFSVLNKCEWTFLLLIMITCFFNRPRAAVLYFIIIAGAILLAETVWLLPQLDIRAIQYISGQQRQGKDIHWIYILLDIVKVPFLFMIGWQELAGKWRSAKT